MARREDQTTEDNIILTGFMGTGKSSVGRLLAEHLGYEFVDTDEWIAARCGKAIYDIFRDQGEAAFREMEAALARELGGVKKKVIATGGRLMLDAANAAALSRTGRVFTLWATPEEIMVRVANDTAAVRPLLEGPSIEARIQVLYEKRRAGYARFTPIETSGKTITEVVQLVLNHLADDVT